MAGFRDDPGTASQPNLIHQVMNHKILITTFTFQPNKDGIAEAAGLMAFWLAERGHDVVVLTGSLPDRHDFQPHPRLRIQQFNANFHRLFDAVSQEDSEHIRNFIRHENPDVIICHCCEIWTAANAEQVFDELKAKTILTSHGYTTHIWLPRARPPFGLGVWSRHFLRYVTRLPWVLRRYDRVVFLSRKQDWGRFFDHRLAKLTGHQGIRVIPNGTDANPKRASEQDFRRDFIPGSGLSVCYVANYSPRKNQARAIRVFRKAALKDASLILIGSEFNAYSESLKELDLQLQKVYPAGTVVFLEKLDRLTTLAAYSTCDVFLLAADAETQPIVLLEAMAAGQPFVTTNVGCVTELPGGIVANSEAGLSEALVTLQNSPEKRKQLGDLGRTAVMQDFTKEKVMTAYENLIQELFPMQ